ncbi:MAG TPA: TolC family protein [Verrucomicrobiota bacterium]|nr:transporter [Verrucomicrobiales bacterium]HRI11772.1 TolC family protein [Verrucomicrobiota bacterium]
MSRSIFYLTVCLAAAIGLVARAANDATSADAVTIEELVSSTLAQSPELRFYEAEIAAAQAGRKTAGLLANPEVSGSIGTKRTRDAADNLAGEGLAWSVSAMQNFEWPGRLGLRKAIANRDVALAELGLARFRASLAARTRLLAYGLFAAEEKAEATAEVADRMRALKEVLVQRDPAGITPLLETRVIEATELTTQRQAAEAALAVESALLELNALRGLTNSGRLVVKPAELSFRPTFELPQLLSLARTNNFDLRLRAVELEQQGFRVDLAKNERWPGISVGPMISEENAVDRERIIGAGVSFPLPLWNRNGANIAAAKARQLQAETLLAVAERDTDRQVIQAATTYRTKLREMERWRPDAIAHFRSAADLADRQYRLSALPAATYVELQRQYLEAMSGLLDTKREALEAAQQLELLTGLPEPLVTTKPPEARP